MKRLTPETYDQIAQLELQVWNGGEEIDGRRYIPPAVIWTVVWPNGDYLGMSRHPRDPQGICKRGTGAIYNPPCELDGRIVFSPIMGRFMAFENLPIDCQKAVVVEIATSGCLN